MCITLIGGMDRLRADYMAKARENGHELKFISKNERNFTDKIGNPDAMLIFTNKISHEAKRKAEKAARRRGIPLTMLHSCGISSLNQYLSTLQIDKNFI